MMDFFTLSVPVAISSVFHWLMPAMRPLAWVEREGVGVPRISTSYIRNSPNCPDRKELHVFATEHTGSTLLWSRETGETRQVAMHEKEDHGKPLSRAFRHLQLAR